MRYFTALIVLPLGAATMIGCSQLNPARPTRADTNISPVAAPFEVSMDAQSDAGKVVRITSGEVNVRQSPVTRTIELKGTAGMRLSAWFEAAANFGADDCQPCLPGDPVHLEGIVSGLSLSGTVTFRGQTYRLGGIGNFDAGAHLVFTGDSLVMPQFTADGTAVLEAPFGLTGVLSIPGPAPAGVATSYTLTGQGLATLAFAQRFAAPDVPVWSISSVTFDFGR